MALQLKWLSKDVTLLLPDRTTMTTYDAYCLIFDTQKKKHFIPLDLGLF